jgi:hypothetical protein
VRAGDHAWVPTGGVTMADLLSEGG